MPIARYANGDSGVPFWHTSSRAEQARRKRLAVKTALLFQGLRERKELSIKELAERSCVSKARLKNFENAFQRPTLDELFRMAPVLGLRPAQIVWRITAKPKPAKPGSPIHAKAHGQLREVRP